MLRQLRTWIIILALAASGAGAAVGTVLAGYVQGEMTIAVSHPIQVQKPIVAGIPSGRGWFGGVSDDGTVFSAAAELYQGEEARIKVPIVNRANVDHVIEIDITPPTLPPGDGSAAYSIAIDVDGIGIINDVVRVGPYKWKGTVGAGSAGMDSLHPDGMDGIKITVALGDLVSPGYYEFSGEIHVVAY